ncbi:MAG: SprT family zinc-dependent metalloprotease [Anaerolineales bacterium]
MMDYRLICSRRRTIALIVQNDGALVVRAPLRAPEEAIREFVARKADWIRKQQARARRLAEATVRRYVDGETFFYLGQAYALKIVPPCRPALRLTEVFELSRSAQPQAEAVFVRWYRARAAEVLAERVEALARQHGFALKKVRITSARSRWGSCSPTGTLSFPWRLVMAPPAVIDYVVVHELVHLDIKNHSPAFWARVGEILPDYKKHVAWLRRNGRRLTLGGG